MSKVLMMYFNQDNVLLRRADRYHASSMSVSEEAQDFDDSLEYLFVSHYDTPRVYLASHSTGRKYSMFLDSFDDAIQLGCFQNNHITGRFRFEKRGQSQAIKLALTPEQKAKLEQHNKTKFSFRM